MPEMDGVALLQALRQSPKTRTVPVVLMSARAGEEARLAGLETGADDYLVKPFSTRELVTRVRTHLEMARVRREAAEIRAALIDELERKNLDLRTAYSELQTTQTQLVQSAKMASLGELVAGVAHEINNPLAFALGHLDTVVRSLARVEARLRAHLDDEVTPQWNRALDRLREMQTGLMRIQELVTKLRTFSRLDEGEQKQVSVRESVASLLTILEHRCDERIEVVTSFSELDFVECYPSLLNQAVMNLVSNAIDAMAEGGRLTISTRAEGDSYSIVVEDTGCGIPEEIRDRVLEPFFTTKPVGQGTGLGLAIAYSIAKKHGGDLVLAPASGGGTSAIFRFPLTRH
jgi:two-component system, NtrC family, sensor kinase